MTTPTLLLFIIDCDLRVFVQFTEGTLHQVWIPRSARFYLGFVLEPDRADTLVPVDGSVSFETSVDVWVERTLSMNVHWQDNHACAMQNQPLLEEALRNWEKLKNIIHLRKTTNDWVVSMSGKARPMPTSGSMQAGLNG